MYFKFSFLFVIINSFILNAQNLDKLTGLSDNYLEKEIRIYKDRGITNSGVVFRVYKNSKQWNAETIQWFLPKEISSNEFQIISPITKNISADKNLELIFMTLEALNIGQLPMENAFEYKKEKKSIIWDEDEKGFVMQTSKISILDGNSYSVIYKAGQYYNEFTYNNPESYLQKFPEIDELKSFQKILEYIREQFNLNF
ncbi:hypothetical protein CBW16_07690 [Flavobacteriaceae bacterium JJC]|nr:hypothetical protein CBW16_07690 [Flavobacteriaceae bacterium JJC]